MKRIITLFAISILFSACAKKIGDKCELDAECSPNMDRNCDRSQPDGYCLIIGCSPDECPEEASCVEFTTPCPTGEGYDDETEQTLPDAGEIDGGELPAFDFDKCRLIEANRGRTYCLQHCKSRADCREGYVCAEVTDLPAAIIDFKGNKTKICVPRT